MTWVQMISNIVLVVVTAVYAFLTWKLAKSSKAASDSAERSAIAAERAVAATLAELNVSFEVTPAYSIGYVEGDEEMKQFLDVQVICDGATVYVHDATLLSAAHIQEIDSSGHRAIGAVNGPHALTLVAHPEEAEPGDFAGPRLLHKGEGVMFSGDPEILLERQEGIGHLRVQVTYSVERDGRRMQRLCRWEGEPEVDFTVIPAAEK